nr:hypothetical protein [Tanacetum cinerariifolium]
MATTIEQQVALDEALVPNAQRTMATTIDQQVALDEALVPSTKRLRIRRSNFRLPSDIQSKESTLQVVYDFLRNSPFFRAFQVTADVPEIYIHEFWATAKLHHNSICFKMDTKKSKCDSASSTTPPTPTPTTTVVSAPRLSAAAKGKQPASATTPTKPTDVKRTEAKKLKIVLKRSRQETHISQQRGSLTKAADYGHIKWIEDLVPRTMWIQEPLNYDKHALWGVSHWGQKRQQFYGFVVNRESSLDVYSKRRIIAVIDLKIVEWYNYKHLDWISDIYEEYRHSAAYGRSSTGSRKLPEKDKKNRLMRIDELHKFSDGTFNDIRNALDDRLKGIMIQYLPTIIWRKGDKDRATAMIQAIDKMLKTR